MARTAQVQASDGPLSAPSGLDPARLRIALARVSRRLRPTGAAARLTTTEVDVLLVAVRRGPASMSDMAAFCGLNPTMLSRLVARLERSGLLERHAGATDRRVWLLSATPAGSALVDKVLAERDDALSHLLEELSPPELAALAAATPVLETLAERLKPAPVDEAGR